MSLTIIGEIQPLSEGRINISLGKNPNDNNDNFLHFDVTTAPVAVAIRTLLASSVAEKGKQKEFKMLLDETKSKTLGDFAEYAKKLKGEKILRIYANVLVKMGWMKSAAITKVKKYNDIIDNLTQAGTKAYLKPSSLVKKLEKFFINPSWENLEGEFVGTLGNPVCVVPNKAELEKNPLYEKYIKPALKQQNITILSTGALLREVDWVLSLDNIMLQVDAGIDVTATVLSILQTDLNAFINLVKSNGTPACLSELGVDVKTFEKTAKNHTSNGKSGAEKIAYACEALGGTVSTFTEKEDDLLQKLRNHLEVARKNYEADLNDNLLTVWAKTIAKCKAIIEKNPENDALKALYVEHLNAYKMAKNGGGNKEVDEALALFEKATKMTAAVTSFSIPNEIDLNVVSRQGIAVQKLYAKLFPKIEVQLQKKISAGNLDELQQKKATAMIDKIKADLKQFWGKIESEVLVVAQRKLNEIKDQMKVGGMNLELLVDDFGDLHSFTLRSIRFSEKVKEALKITSDNEKTESAGVQLLKMNKLVKEVYELDKTMIKVNDKLRQHMESENAGGFEALIEKGRKVVDKLSQKYGELMVMELH